MIVQEERLEYLTITTSLLNDQEIKNIYPYISGIFDWNQDGQVYIQPCIINELKKSGVIAKCDLVRSGHYDCTSRVQAFRFVANDAKFQIVMNARKMYQITYFKNNKIEYVHHEQSLDRQIYIRDLADCKR